MSSCASRSAEEQRVLRMSGTQRRGRACTACASIKIKCQLGSDVDSQPPCERCVRLNKICVLSAPKKQKDRVAELEAQIASLTRLLRAQGIHEPDPAGELDAASENGSVSRGRVGSVKSGNTKRRRLDADVDVDVDADVEAEGEAAAAIAVDKSSARIDSFCLSDVPIVLQERIFARYLSELFPAFPVVPLPANCSIDSIRLEKPRLLEAVLYAANPTIVSLELQELIASKVLSRLAEAIQANSQKNIDLLHAVSIIVCYYRTPKSHKHITMHQIFQSIPRLAIDIGLGGTDSCTSPVSTKLSDDETESTDCWRAWIASYLLIADLSIFSRRPNILQPWDAHHEECVFFLESSVYRLASDRWLGKFVRAARVCELIAETMGFFELQTCHDVSEPAMTEKLQLCRNMILNWKASVPSTLRTPLILLWENLARIYMHEPILHTSTNKHSFAAPYLAEKLSVTDFPTPIVTDQHITAVYELLSSVHAVIDIYTGFDVETMAAHSGLVLTSRAAYAIYILMKLCVAVSGPGSTLTSVVDISLLRMEEYIDKLVSASVLVHQLDQRSSVARVISIGPMMQEWYANYKFSLSSKQDLGVDHQSAQLVQDTATSKSPFSSSPRTDPLTTTDWETFLQATDANDDLELLLADPFLDDSFLMQENLGTV